MAAKRFPLDLNDIATALAAADKLLGYDADLNKLVNVSVQRILDGIDVLTGAPAKLSNADLFSFYDLGDGQSYKAAISDLSQVVMDFISSLDSSGWTTESNSQDQVPVYDASQSKTIQTTIFGFIQRALISVGNFTENASPVDADKLFVLNGGVSKWMDLSGVRSFLGVESGTYSPVLNTVSNVSSINSTFGHHYFAFGDKVLVLGGASLTWSSSGVTQIRVSLPFAATVSSQTANVSGVTTTVALDMEGGGDVTGDATNDEATMRWRAQAGNGPAWFFWIFQYTRD